MLAKHSNISKFTEHFRDISQILDSGKKLRKKEHLQQLEIQDE